MRYLTVFRISVRIGTREEAAYDVSPSEAVQKFIKLARALKMTDDQLIDLKAEFREITLP